MRKYVSMYKIPLRNVVGLKSRGCRRLKRVDSLGIPIS